MIQGGHIHEAYGGGNGEIKPADVNGNVTLAIHGGNVDLSFGGSNQQGTISGHSKSPSTVKAVAANPKSKSSSAAETSPTTMAISMPPSIVPMDYISIISTAAANKLMSCPPAIRLAMCILL